MKAGATLLAGHRGRRPGRSTAAWSRGAVVEGQGRRRAARRSGPATSWSPTAPTRASAARSAPPATASYPQGMAIRGYYESPLHDEPWIECRLDVRDRNGNVAARLRLDLPGRRRHGQRRHRPAVDVPRLEGGQHLPPDGRVRRDCARVLGHRARDVVRAADRRPAADGRLGRARRSGPTWLVVGDAGRRRSTRSTARASTTPTRPAGMAADLLDEALTTGDGLALQRYPTLLDDEYGLYFKVARLFAKVIGQPGADARARPGSGMQSPHAHGVGAAHHGQPAAPRRARPGRGRLPGRRRSSASSGEACAD